MIQKTIMRYLALILSIVISSGMLRTINETIPPPKSDRESIIQEYFQL